MEKLRHRDREELALGPKDLRLALGPKDLRQESTSGALSLLLRFERAREPVGRGQTQNRVHEDA